MPESKTSSSNDQGIRNQAGGSQSIATSQDRTRRGLSRWASPGTPSYGGALDLFDRMTEEMNNVFDRMFGDFGMSRRPGMSRGLFNTSNRQGIWSPRVEAFQQGDRFVVRAELPGLKKDDVQVEMTDDALTIRGERREEQEEERDGYFRSEREYGQFFRAIPLPEGTIGESAQASFRDGVLEVTMQAAPSEANRGRRLEIREGSSQGDQKK
jgi:HSP20 family protein